MYTLDDITSFLEKILLKKKINHNADIFKDFGCVGDDFHELIERYAESFQVDMSTYLWYFHTDEEGWNFGGFFIKPPYNRVNRIPVTPIMLLEFANTKKWDLKYPEHRLPKKRYDILINFLPTIILLNFVVYILILKYTR